MDSNFSSSPDKKGSGQGQSTKGSVLVLHNDDINSFEFIMKTLEEICDHTLVQAEQCATITHYNGKCEILNGDSNDLKEIQRELSSLGLKVTIE